MIRNNFCISHYQRCNLSGLRELWKKNKNQEKFTLEIANVDFSEAPKAPIKSDFVKVITYLNGMKETLFDEVAFQSAMEDYCEKKAEYDVKIQEQNNNIAAQQVQDYYETKLENDSKINEQNVQTAEQKKLEQELQLNFSKSKTEKIDSELKKIRRLLFGSEDITKVYYEQSV